MPYTIKTKDGITLDNIPDDIDPKDERIKQLVTERRSSMQKERFSSPEFQQKVAEQQAADRAEYNPTSGMGTFDRVAANVGAGAMNFGQGLAQLALPKSLERAVGITDESINEKRQRDQVLADSTIGGKALQVVGEALPGFAIPGGSVARGLGALPKVGNAIKAAGIGTRVLPTLLAEGAGLGALQGAITPTTSQDSVIGNTVVGAVGGAVVPAGLYGLGMAARPLSRGLQQRALASKVGEMMDVSPQAQKTLGKAVAQSNSRVVNAPQSLAALTQNPEVAALELAARANPETAPSWVRFDEAAGNGRWKALADALGNDTSVEAAKKATDTYAKTAVPEVFKAVKPKVLTEAVTDFGSAVQGRLNSAVQKADPAGQEVYGYVKKAMESGDGSPQMLWNVRKTLSQWLDGTPPPGMEGTRATKMDREIMEVRSAIDSTLNRATGNKWSSFLGKYADYAKKEAAQKAGQNIRNVFFDETLARTQGPSTGAGNPAVTRARLSQALKRFGTNEFGETLDFPQRNVVDQVLDDLHADEILQRVKSGMTGKGGSQTAPLTALLKKEGVGPGGSWFSEIAKTVSNVSQKQQREMLNGILQNPEDALLIIRQAEKMKRPLSNPEKYLVQAARGLVASPSLQVLAQQPGNAASAAP